MTTDPTPTEAPFGEEELEGATIGGADSSIEADRLAAAGKDVDSEVRPDQTSDEADYRAADPGPTDR